MFNVKTRGKVRRIAAFLAIVISVCMLLCTAAYAGNLTEKVAQNEFADGLASAARSQIGSNQFRIWYKDDLPDGGDWSALLVTSCLNSAEMWKTDYYSTDSQTLYDNLDNAGIVRAASGYEPFPGDVAFFNDEGGLRSGIVAGMYSDGTVAIVSADDEGSAVAVMCNYASDVLAYAVVPVDWYGVDSDDVTEPSDDTGDITEPGTEPGTDADPSTSPDPSVSPKPETSPKPDASPAPGDDDQTPDDTKKPSDDTDDDFTSKPLIEVINGWYIAAGVAVLVIIAVVLLVIRKKRRVQRAYSDLFSDLGKK